MNIKIKNISSVNYKKTVNVFARAFVNDPLNIFAFPDEKERARITEIIYKFVIMSMVPEMDLKIKGAFENEKIVGALIYTLPESKIGWINKLDSAVIEMRRKANNEKMKLIGEYAIKSAKYKPKFPHIYLNELAVLPEFQNHGIGTDLMKSAETESEKHTTAVGLGLDTTNINNVRLYKKLGYEIVKEFKFYELKGFSMFKKLKP